MFNSIREAVNNAEISYNTEINSLKNEIVRLNGIIDGRFVWGDATRKQSIGLPGQFPICYESAFYPNTVTNRSSVTIDRNYVLNTTMPTWRATYPNSPRWTADIEWQNSGGVTAAEVSKLLPGFQAAREFADKEGKGLKLSGYGFPARFGTHLTDEEVRAQRNIIKPILDLLDETVLTLYPIYSDIEKSRTYIRRNISLGKELGKKVYVLGWPVWHPNVGGVLSGTTVSVEWWKMMLEEVYNNADGFALWLLASAPNPTTEPWWIETLRFIASKG